jgi:gamma-glutamyltranspeptidase/glutathione hydrolase
VVTDPRSLARREGTSQAAAADRDGNLASCCISVGSAWGSVVYVPALGCFLNNAMQNYDPRPGLPNSIAPGKMPIFAAPAMVAARRGKPVFAGSGSGGYRIETAVLHAFLNMVDHGMKAQAAVDHPRVHCQGQETVVDARIPEAVRAKLAKAGHKVMVDGEVPGNWPFGRVCTVAVDARRKRLSGAAGPNWNTGIAGY